MTTFAIAHTNPDGKSGVACKLIGAANVGHAYKLFMQQHPDRKISVIGELGKED